LASRELEAILAAMFEADFCQPQEKQAREKRRDELLRAQGEKADMPWERLRLAIASSRYLEYRRQRLATELGSIPPKLRGK
jgi:hypothetical protein